MSLQLEKTYLIIMQKIQQIDHTVRILKSQHITGVAQGFSEVH